MIQEAINLLGYEGKDKVIGFEGIVESVSFDLYGCIQLWMKPTSLKEDGSQKEGGYFDISRIVIETSIIPAPKFKDEEKIPSQYDKGPAQKAPRN